MRNPNTPDGQTIQPGTPLVRSVGWVPPLQETIKVKKPQRKQPEEGRAVCILEPF